MDQINKPFEVRVSLGFGEFLVFKNCTIVNQNECEDVCQLNWISQEKHIEYLPYWKWFWEEIFDLDTLCYEPDDKTNISIEIDGVNIPIESLTFVRVGCVEDAISLNIGGNVEWDIKF